MKIYYAGAVYNPINGGGKVFIEHAYNLNKHGIQSYVVCNSEIDWWFNGTDKFRIPDTVFFREFSDQEDVLAFTAPWEYGRYRNIGRNVVYIIQGFRDEVHHPTDRFFKEDKMIVRNDKVKKIAISQSISDYHKKHDGVDIPVLNNGIMIDEYLLENCKKENSIFIHLRKGSDLSGRFFESFYESDLSDKISIKKESKIIPCKKMVEVYGKSKYIIDFSYVDGFGLIPLESMGSGCIAICMDSGGNREYLKNGINSFVFDKDDPDLSKKIIDTIKMVEDDEEMYERIKSEAYKTAKEFSWDNKIKGYIDFYKNI